MPRLVFTVPGRNPQPYRFQLDRRSVSIGRGSENDIVIDDGSVSINHAVMERIEGGYQLRDVGSTNGIKLEGKKSEKIPLRHGITVKIGDVAFDFTLTEEERAALYREKPEEQSPIIKEEELEPAAAGDKVARPARPPGAPAPEYVFQSGPGPIANFAMTALFLALALAAFWIGMCLKYQKTHGTSSPWALWHDSKKARAKAAAEEAAADSEKKEKEAAEKPEELPPATVPDTTPAPPTAPEATPAPAPVTPPEANPAPAAPPETPAAPDDGTKKPE